MNKNDKVISTYKELEKIVKDKLINKTEKRSFEDLSELLFGEGNCYSDTEVRKRMYGMKRVVEIIDNDAIVYTNNKIKELNEKIRDLEQAKIQLRDEKNEYNRQNRDSARIKTTLELLSKELKEIGKIKFDINNIDNNIDNNISNGIDNNVSNSILLDNEEKEMIISLSDLHTGQTFKSYFGEYNIEIEKERLQQYLNKILKIGKLYNIKTVRILSLGDQISGNIHKTIQVSNKENVIEQIKIAVSYICSFCDVLCNSFEKVFLYSVAGNHSRLEPNFKEAIHLERIDDLISWIIGKLLNHKNNFKYIEEANIDNGIIQFDIFDKTYLGVHGDMDIGDKKNISDLCGIVKKIPYAIFKGHKHFPESTEVNGIKIIQSGSLVGSGDDHTIEKRLSGKPSQTLCIVDKNGIECIYNIELD